jgi:enamine deaminase RidA (YjgF/YER057c/UK114 family)
MAVRRFHTGKRMSEAVSCNGILWLAGQVADDPTQDIVGQTRQVLTAIDRLLTDAGTDRTQLLSANIFLADMADFAAMNSVWDQWIAEGGKPARATVQAALARPEWRIEIVATAALR